jgi:hypothetical protein
MLTLTVDAAFPSFGKFTFASKLFIVHVSNITYPATGGSPKWCVLKWYWPVQNTGDANFMPSWHQEQGDNHKQHLSSQLSTHLNSSP